MAKKKLTQEQLAAKVDELGALMAHANPLNKRIEELKTEIKKAHGEGRIKGHFYEAIISASKCTRIIAELVRKLLKPSDLKKVQREVPQLSVEVHAITAK